MNPETDQPVHDHAFGTYCNTRCPRWGHSEPQPGWEWQQDWLFTFGADHTHPDSGQRLGRNYVRIHGTCDSTREVMLQAFGNRWSNQYRSAEKAGVEEYGLTEVPMPKRGFDVTDDATHHDIWPAEQPFEEQVDTHLQRLAAERPTPVTPAEERTDGLSLRELIDGLLSAAGEPDFDVDTSCRDEILRRFGTPEHAGVSDVQAAAAALRAYLEDLQDGFLQSESSAIFEALGKVERHIRGER